MSRERDDDDGDDNERRDEPIIGYPAMVGWAARAWILFGLLILVSGGANVAMQLTQGMPNAPPGQGAASAGGGMCGLALVLLFGIAFIWVGSQTLRGEATDTMGNGIGSLVFGVLNLGCGVMVVIVGGATAAVAGGGMVALVALIAGIINLAAGAGLVAAGVMALTGRSQYLEWRRSQRGR